MRTVAAVLALIVCVHAGLWALLRTQTTAPDISSQLASVSYSPFADSDNPDSGTRPTAEQIRADLKAIAPYTRAIRRSPPSSVSRFQSAPGSAKTRRAMSGKSTPPSSWRATTATSTPSLSAMKRFIAAS
jgi:exo-beta-1,3-glucanase (GH17 family)